MWLGTVEKMDFSCGCYWFLFLNAVTGFLTMKTSIIFLPEHIYFLNFFLFLGEGLEPAFSFLATLASSTSEEIESQLQERVESSRRAVAQIVTMYDKLQEKVDVLSHKLNSGGRTKVVDPWLMLKDPCLIAS